MFKSQPSGKLLFVTLALLAVSSFFVAARAQGGGSEWVRVEPAGAGFSALMPKKPEESSERVPLMGNNYAMRSFAAIDAGGVFYNVMTQDLPTLATGLPPGPWLDQFMEGFRKGLADGLKGSPAPTVELTARRDLELNGHAGRQYHLAVAESRGLVRVYPVGRRVYILMIIGGREADANVARFLNSFKLHAPAPSPRADRAELPKQDAKPSSPGGPTIQIDPVLTPPDNKPIPYGDPKSGSPRQPSGPGTGGGTGTGRGGGIGSGTGGGVDPGYGGGVGPGRGGNTGGGDPYAGGGGPGGAGGPVDYNKTFSQREVTRKAMVTFKPEPSFTEDAMENDTTGVVRLRMALGADGAVRNISVIKGLPDGLTENAIAAARAIKFTPAQKDGRIVSQWVTIEYNFNVDDYPYEANPRITRKAVILEKPVAEYTKEARANGVEGTVVLSVVLKKRGEVGVEVVKGLPDGLTERAIDAARRIRFTPAEIDGKPVTVSRKIEYVFSLK